MAVDDRTHQLLPWYVTGTLDPAEADVFREHLAGCPDCREEMAVLQKIRDAVDRHGESFMSDHPPAERLVAAVRGNAPEAEREEILRHVGLCVSCATESRWIMGDLPAGAAVPTPSPSTRASSRNLGPWIALAAAVVALAVLFPVLRPERRQDAILRPQYLIPTERSSSPRIVEFSEDRPLVLVLEPDLPASAFPIDVEIVAAGGKVVVREADIDRTVLLDGLYLFVSCDPGHCVPGEYTVRIRSSTSDGTASEIRFRVDRP